MKVYKGSQEQEVVHPIDVQGWLDDGWSLEKEVKKAPRDLLVEKATELGVEFTEQTSNKDLKALIEAKEAELKAAE